MLVYLFMCVSIFYFEICKGVWREITKTGCTRKYNIDQEMSPALIGWSIEVHYSRTLFIPMSDLSEILALYKNTNHVHKHAQTSVIKFDEQ